MTINSFSGKYRFLSNFYPSPIVIGGIEYPTAEHAFQAGKTEDADLARWIAEDVSPMVAKARGRKVALRNDWEERKDDWMARVLAEKFRQHPDLAQQLAATGDQQLIEGNTWHDQIWGDCSCLKHIFTPGDNQLGKLLMKTRSELGGPR